MNAQQAPEFNARHSFLSAAIHVASVNVQATMPGTILYKKNTAKMVNTILVGEENKFSLTHLIGPVDPNGGGKSG